MSITISRNIYVNDWGWSSFNQTIFLGRYVIRWHR